MWSLLGKIVTLYKVTGCIGFIVPVCCIEAFMVAKAYAIGKLNMLLVAAAMWRVNVIPSFILWKIWDFNPLWQLI